MAVIKFAYTGKCAGDHVHFNLLVNGAVRSSFTTTQTQLKTARASDEDIERFGTMMIAAFCRGWAKANPTGTLVQMKNALEAQEWEF